MASGEGQTSSGGLSLRTSDSLGWLVLPGAAKDSRELKDDRGATEEKAAVKLP